MFCLIKQNNFNSAKFIYKKFQKIKRNEDWNNFLVIFKALFLASLYKRLSKQILILLVNRKIRHFSRWLLPGLMRAEFDKEREGDFINGKRIDLLDKMLARRIYLPVDTARRRSCYRLDKISASLSNLRHQSNVRIRTV